MITAAQHRTSVAEAMSEDALLAQVRRLASDLGWMTYTRTTPAAQSQGSPTSS